MFLLLEISLVHISHFRWFPLIYIPTLGFPLHSLPIFLCLLLWSKVTFSLIIASTKKKKKKSTTWHYLRISVTFSLPFSPCLCLALLVTLPNPRAVTSPRLRHYLGLPSKLLVFVSYWLLDIPLGVFPEFQTQYRTKQCQSSPGFLNLSQSQEHQLLLPWYTHLIRDEVLLVPPPPPLLNLSWLSPTPAHIPLISCLAITTFTSQRCLFLCQSPV